LNLEEPTMIRLHFAALAVALAVLVGACSMEGIEPLPVQGVPCTAFEVDACITVQCDGDAPVTVCNGAPGVDGEPGSDGTPGIDGAPGVDAEPCTSTTVFGEAGEVLGVQVQCPGSDSVFVENGTDGLPGAIGATGSTGATGSSGTDGTDGTSCTVTTLNTGIQITCPDGTSAFVPFATSNPLLEWVNKQAYIPCPNAREVDGGTVQNIGGYGFDPGSTFRGFTSYTNHSIAAPLGAAVMRVISANASTFRKLYGQALPSYLSSTSAVCFDGNYTPAMGAPCWDYHMPEWSRIEDQATLSNDVVSLEAGGLRVQALCGFGIEATGAGSGSGYYETAGEVFVFYRELVEVPL
jgi:hypothetical protein